ASLFARWTVRTSTSGPTLVRRSSAATFTDTSFRSAVPSGTVIVGFCVNPTCVEVTPLVTRVIVYRHGCAPVTPAPVSVGCTPTPSPSSAVAALSPDHASTSCSYAVKPTSVPSAATATNGSAGPSVPYTSTCQVASLPFPLSTVSNST